LRKLTVYSRGDREESPASLSPDGRYVAYSDKDGLFQAANGGTLFLDEVADLPLETQVKLLRAIQEKAVRPVGAQKELHTDVRILSATNKGLETAVKEGAFREDLFYRLNVMRIELPPLRERRADLPLLIRHTLRQLCAARNYPLPKISGPAMNILLNLDYPGNVRELENILEHALIIARGDLIGTEHLPAYTAAQTAAARQPAAPAAADPPNPRDDADRRNIVKALQKHNGNRTRTAGALRIDRTTLWRKMKKYGIRGY